MFQPQLHMPLPAIILGFCITVFLFSCESEPFDTDNVSSTSNNENQKLIVTAHHFYRQNGGLIDSLLPDVQVQVYNTAQNRQNEEHVARTGRTNSEGIAEFNYMNDSIYYIKAVSPYPQMSPLYEEATMPAQAVTVYLELDFN